MKKWRYQRHRPVSIAYLVIFLCGCATISSEESNYPGHWPTLTTAKTDHCNPPLGTFNNISSNAHYEYENSYQFPAPTMAHIFISDFSIIDVTHINIEAVGKKQLRIKAFGISNGMEKLIGEQLFDLDQSYCKNNRWALASKTTHEGFKDYNQEKYDPLYTAAYWIGPFGLGAPISKWWEYRFTSSANGGLAVRRLKMESALLFSVYTRIAMNDDWFLFEPADLQKLIRDQVSSQQHLNGSPETGPIAQLHHCTVDNDLTATEIYNVGVIFYRDGKYASALQCFLSAATHTQEASPEAMWKLCLMYELGQGTAPDTDSAKHWCALAEKH